MANVYDVIVIGLGHAGVEAALAAARLGCRTLALTLSLDSIAHMPCNPSIGGPAKGHLVREIDAIGGQMGITTDETLIQLKVLNTSKGPAVRALRAQVDKVQYHLRMKNILEAESNLEIKQLLVEKLIMSGNKVIGVQCQGDIDIYGTTVIITTGTYLGGKIYIGSHSHVGGPNSQLASIGLGSFLFKIGLKMARFKTGTPPRLNGHTIDFTKMIIQPGDSVSSGFSFLKVPIQSQLMPCYLTYTNNLTHDIINDNLHSAPMFSGAITGTGPRYCPSIESKIVAFPDRERHQLFVEPEGLSSHEYYLGGFSTSLAEEIQEQMVRTIQGLERVQILRYGYAIEYDVILPFQLTRWLEIKGFENMFSAGQINGTSGYEEAAAQGLIAGINAARRVKGLDPAILERHEAYIGVLIDDLVTKGPEEPYRMLTTMAEYRMLLRQDNADARLTPRAREWGLASDARYELLEEKQALVEKELIRLKTTNIKGADILSSESIKLYELLKRPEYNYNNTALFDKERPTLPEDVIEQAEVTIKYSGYIDRQLEQIDRVKRHEGKILVDVDFQEVSGLSTEAKEKLIKVRPDTLGQASRIAGVTPADVTALMLYLMRKKGADQDTSRR